jgi:hypothetical protein
VWCDIGYSEYIFEENQALRELPVVLLFAVSLMDKTVVPGLPVVYAR